MQFDEPARSGGKIADDEQRPFVAYEIEGARIGRPLVVGVTFGRWNRWYERPPWCGLAVCAEYSLRQRKVAAIDIYGR